MEINANNCFGLARASLDISGVITIVAGRNHQGKSSLLRATACVLTGDSLPLGLKKNEGNQAVKEGALKGDVTFHDDDGSFRKIFWPEASPSTKGNPRLITAVAAGLDKLSDFTVKELAEHLAFVTGSTPTEADLRAALPEGMEEVVKKVWASIQADGFDTALKRAEETGSNLKAQWRAHTGETYGSVKAKTWQPQGWDHTLEGVTMEALEDRITMARAEADAAIANQAVESSNIGEFRQLSAGLEKLKGDQNLLQSEKEVALKARSYASSTLEGAKREVAEINQLTCPHCGKPVRLVSGKLTYAQEIPDGERERREAALKQAEQAAKQAEEHFQAIVKREVELTTEIRRAEHASQQVEVSSKKGVSITPEQVLQKKAAVEEATRNLTMAKTKKEVDKISRQIDVNQHIINALAPQGIRQNALLRSLDKINQALEAWCDLTGWQPICVGEDLRLTLSGRYFRLLSGSEQWMVNTAMQIVISRMTEDFIVILDGADILDITNIQGLFKGLLMTRQAAIIGWTGRPEKLPAVITKRGGRIYEAAGGVVTEYHPEATQEQAA